MLATKPRTDIRRIAYQTRGSTHGPITRLVSPSDLGEVMKPFVFLDLAYFDEAKPTPMEYLWHPHSGIATVTVMLDGAVRVADTTGTDLVLPKGGVEWMRAGNGVWHTGQAQPGVGEGVPAVGRASARARERTERDSYYAMPEQSSGRRTGARDPRRRTATRKSPIDAPPMTYLQVNLKAGERWRYSRRTVTSSRGWPSPTARCGRRLACTPARSRCSSQSSGAIDFVAEGDTRFVLGSAVPHPHELFLGNYSVHTSEAALRQGEAEIVRIGRRAPRQRHAPSSSACGQTLIRRNTPGF